MFGRRQPPPGSSKVEVLHVPSPLPTPSTQPPAVKASKHVTHTLPALPPHYSPPSSPTPHPSTLVLSSALSPPPRRRPRHSPNLPHIRYPSPNPTRSSNASLSASVSPYLSSHPQGRRSHRNSSIPHTSTSSSSSLTPSFNSSHRPSAVDSPPNPPSSLPPLLRSKTVVTSNGTHHSARADTDEVRKPSNRDRQMRSGSMITIPTLTAITRKAKDVSPPDTGVSSLTKEEKEEGDVGRMVEEVKEEVTEAMEKKGPGSVVAPGGMKGDTASAPRRRVGGMSSYPSSASPPTESSPSHGWSSSSTASPPSPTGGMGRGKRRDRRRLESALKEIQEMAAEGDIDEWVDTGGYVSDGAGWGGPGQVTVAVEEDANPTHRKAMEDTHTLRLSFPSPESPPCPSAFFGVYDGHGGGSHASVYARKHLHRIFAKHLKDKEGVEEAFTAAFLELDEVMSRSRRFSVCGTTAVCALLQAKDGGVTVVMANVGDTQGYLLHPSCPPYSLTAIHTPSNSAECERVKGVGGHILLGRVNGVMAVTRALGDTAMKKVGIVGSPEVREGRVEGGSEGFIVMACDGVWDVMGVDEVAGEVWKGQAEGETGQQTVNRLCRLCIDKGTTDNVTVVLVHIRL